MPDPSGNFTPAELTAQLQQFTGGTPGMSPATQAAIDAFQQAQLPVIQQQFQLQGLGRSPALGSAVAGGLTQAMVPFMQQDLSNRLQATGMGAQQQQFGQQFGLQQELGRGQLGLGQRAQSLAEFMQPAQLGQSAAGLAAQIGQNESNRQLQALGLQGQLAMGMTDPMARAAALEQQRQQMALQGFGAAGTAQRDVTQQLIDEQQREFLRRQGLAEQGTVGVFGTVLPPAMQSGSTTTSRPSGGK